MIDELPYWVKRLVVDACGYAIGGLALFCAFVVVCWLGYQLLHDSFALTLAGIGMGGWLVLRLPVFRDFFDHL